MARLARFTRTIADDAGRLPCFGDEDGGALFPICGRDPFDVADSLQLAACLLDDPDLAVGAPAEEVVWMTGEIPVASRQIRWPSAGLTDSGYFVSRSGRGDHLVIDSGPHGFLNGGHAHADALAVTLNVRGRALFIDPGTGCYTIDPAVRDRFRSTPCHNTLTLDERPQSEPRGPFHWHTAARATALDWQSDTDREFDYFEGIHDGYEPVVHHRAILSRPGCWIVVDRIIGHGFRRADLHWHLDPRWTSISLSPGLVRAEHPDGLRVWICSPQDELEILQGTGDGSGLGWCAPVYGRLLATSTLRATRHANMPFTMATVILDSPARPDVVVLPATRDDRADDDAIAVRIATPEWTEVAMFTGRRDVDSSPDQRATWRAGGIATDARVLCWRAPCEGPGTAVVSIDGRIAGQE